MFFRNVLLCLLTLIVFMAAPPSVSLGQGGGFDLPPGPGLRERVAEILDGPDLTDPLDESDFPGIGDGIDYELMDNLFNEAKAAERAELREMLLDALEELLFWLDCCQLPDIDYDNLNLDPLTGNS